MPGRGKGFFFDSTGVMWSDAAEQLRGRMGEAGPEAVVFPSDETLRWGGDWYPKASAFWEGKQPDAKFAAVDAAGNRGEWRPATVRQGSPKRRTEAVQRRVAGDKAALTKAQITHAARTAFRNEGMRLSGWAIKGLELRNITPKGK